MPRQSQFDNVDYTNMEHILTFLSHDVLDETTTTKLCAACYEELPQSSFSKKQWQLKQYQRRCRECIDAYRVVQLKAPPKNESAEVQHPSTPSCYICLEEGTDESGQPPRRDCSCRGESTGFAHLSCIVKYAEKKSEQFDGLDVNELTNEFVEPWYVCPNCKQDYQDEMAVDLANEFMAYVERQYPDDQSRQLAALDMKLVSLADMAACLQPTQKEDAVQTAKLMLVMIEKMKAQTPSLPKRILMIEALTYINLGRITDGEGTHEGAKFTVAYFEKAQDLSKAIGFTVVIAVAETNIAIAKSRYEGSNSVSLEDMLAKSQALYKEVTEKQGQEATSTIKIGMNLAIHLQESYHGIEAERLLTKLAAMCHQIHGPDHCTTQQVEFKLKLRKLRQVVTCFQALRYEESGKKCVIQGTIEKPRIIQDEKTFAVTSDDIIFALGTPAVCHGLDTSPHLNGKIDDLRSRDRETGYYRVHFEDEDLEPCLVKQENRRILF